MLIRDSVASKPVNIFVGSKLRYLRRVEMEAGKRSIVPAKGTELEAKSVALFFLLSEHVTRLPGVR